MAQSFVFGFQELDRSMLPLAGGKGANLGELNRIPGIQVPDGFCISTGAYTRILAESPSSNGLLDRLALLKPDDRDGIAALSGQIRKAIEATPIPTDIQDEITSALASFGPAQAYAVRSSATAEDLPTASFAGQQDSYLNIIGASGILGHVGKCWASLFTERAVMYRLRNGFDHRKVRLAVVVQKMVFPQAAGILFTADPLSGNRKISSIDAGFGLGEAMVSGLVDADNFKVRDGAIVGKRISAKRVAIHALLAGGTETREVGPDERSAPALTDDQVLRLEGLGRTIEAHFGGPQDIEWCLADGAFHIVQSRPITTLFPIPKAEDGENRVYLSVGHQQMMTDAMKPLGLSVWLLTTRAPMRTAGGRLFVDVTRMLSGPDGGKAMIETVGLSDPLLKDALQAIVGREGFLKRPEATQPQALTPGLSTAGARSRMENDPAMVAGLIRDTEAAQEESRRGIAGKSGPELFEYIVADLARLKPVLMDPKNLGVIFAGIDAAAWINQKMKEWLGEIEVKAADTLSQSVEGNVTSAMGLALVEVADAIRPYPEVIAYLGRAEGDSFLEGLEGVAGGREAREAIEEYLARYGMRCAGEIDITRTRWSEKPAMLAPVILGNIRNLEAGAGRRKFAQGRREAEEKERELLARLRSLPDGEAKAEETARMISMVRNFSGYREFPKYAMISRYFLYKQAMMEEADRLARAGVIGEREDIHYLSFEELREAVRAGKVDEGMIMARKEEFKVFEKLSPPRVLTSEGERIEGSYHRESLPAGALAGLAVSSGVVEGRARVVLRMEDADLQAGDILVTAFTDPSWTPLFVSIAGLVTEVGGLMTHGAVIAREYGLPAVVGVVGATGAIRDGQRVRVHGGHGFVELL